MAKRPGRPSKLTPEVKKRLLDALRAGNKHAAACAYAGIAEPTFYAWKAKGEEQKTGQYAEFLEAVRTAEREAESRAVLAWQKAIKDGNWQAAKDFLARRFPDEWSEVYKHQGKEGGPVELRVVYEKPLPGDDD